MDEAATNVLSGVARVKQFQRLCSQRQGNGFVVYAPFCNVCKNMNFCVFIYHPFHEKRVRICWKRLK